MPEAHASHGGVSDEEQLQQGLRIFSRNEARFDPLLLRAVEERSVEAFDPAARA
jgi:hypothetical protein